MSGPTAVDRSPREGEVAERSRDGSPPRLALCIVNHDGREHLLRTLPAFAERASLFDEILLVDGASRDGGPELARERLPALRILQLGRNAGPGAARNAALRRIRAELVLFADNDVVLGEGVPQLLVEALAATPRAAVAVPRVLHADAPDVVQYEGADAHFLGLMAPRHAAARGEAGPLDRATIGSVVTACFLLDRRRWGDDDPFDETFLFNLEDHDFGLRCRLRGLEIVAVPRARVFHGTGTPGLSFRGGGRPASLRVYCLIRNRWQILLKTYSTRSLVVLAPALAAYEAAQLIGAARRGWLREWAAAGLWIATHPRALLTKRRAVQRTRRRPDRELLRGGPLPLLPETRSGRATALGIGLLERLLDAWWRLVRKAT